MLIHQKKENQKLQYHESTLCGEASYYNVWQMAAE